MDNEITNIANSLSTTWTKPIYNDGGPLLGMPNAGGSPTQARIAQCDALKPGRRCVRWMRNKTNPFIEGK